MAAAGLSVFVETGVNLAGTGAVAAWVFDPAHWGSCGQGATEDEAIADLLHQCGAVGERHTGTVVRERTHGDEQAFQRDLLDPSPVERDLTRSILRDVRRRTLALVRDAAQDVLDRADPARGLPEWASWHTARQLAWHLADTESRYYLPSLGLPAKERAADLVTELEESAAHVARVLDGLPPTALVRRDRGEVWTSVKVLRRLAWHERSELVVLERLLR